MSEMFVDVPINPLPPPETWGTLTLNQLFDVKNALLDKLLTVRTKPAYANPLNAAIAKVDGFISVKLNDPRGGA